MLIGQAFLCPQGSVILIDEFEKLPGIGHKTACRLAFYILNSSEETIEKVIQKDLVVHYNNRRFRGYVYINPTDIKVHQPEITEEGLEVENVYFDNIIHICVYEGKKKLFGRDMKKQDFKLLIPEEYYQRAILSDMDFIGVNAKGYQYQATLCIPNSASCYLINLSISLNGEITYELTQ